MIKVFYDKDTNQPWVVKVCEAEEPRSANGDSKIVEFYDGRYEHTDLGQFVSSYYMSTLLEHPLTHGLDLYGDVPTWTIRQQCMNRILKWLESIAKEDSKCQPEAS